MSVKFNGKHLAKFIRPEEYEAIYPQVEAAHKQLADRTGPGNDFLGWMDLPNTYDKSLRASSRPPRRFARIPTCCWSPASAAATLARAQ